MSKRIFTEEEQEILRNNPYVAKCSDRSITFTAKFKKHAVYVYNKERKGARDIFTSADIPIHIIGRDNPRCLLRLWLKKDENSLGKENRGKHSGGGRKRKERINPDKMTLEEQNFYLKTQNAYINAENDFLAKARGIKRKPFEYLPGKDTD